MANFTQEITWLAAWFRQVRKHEPLFSLALSQPITAQRPGKRAGYGADRGRPTRLYSCLAAL